MTYGPWVIMSSSPPTPSPLLHFQKLLCASTLALLAVYVARCALRSHQWRSEQSLFTSALSVCPLNAKVSLDTFS